MGKFCPTDDNINISQGTIKGACVACYARDPG